MPDTAAKPAAAAESAMPVIAVIGNPNTGKSTLFNALTGLRQKTANYPGVTVERHTGETKLGERPVTLVDLPGTYSLAAQSPDELVAVDVLLGHVENMTRPSAVLAVADATNLRRNLFLLTQLAELGLPIVLALNMTDLAETRGITLDIDRLQKQLLSRFGARIVPVVATTGQGLDRLRDVLAEAIDSTQPVQPRLLPEIAPGVDALHGKMQDAGGHLAPYEIERALIDAGGAAERRFEYVAGPELLAELIDWRARLSAGSSLAAMETRSRYELIGEILNSVEQREVRPPSVAERLDRITNQPLIGTILFIVVMATVFQAVFSWAAPLMELIDGATASLSAMVAGALPPGALSSLIVDGVIAGVGSVIIFLPQILILFAFIIVLEDSGYMPRAAFMMDRMMRSAGLSGQSFIPMLSSFACAVPGILATRVIPERKDRLATILAAPFMTCSARLPVYALLIAAFVPEHTYFGGMINLQGLVLLGLYLLGILGGVLTAFLMKKTLLAGPTPTFLIELPPYRLPQLKSVLIKLLGRARIFLKRAGTVIFSVAVVIWALAYFPRPAAITDQFDIQRTAAIAELRGAALDTRLSQIDGQEAAQLLEQSALGRIGKVVEPIFTPLGWDWKVSAAVVASFPAREVVIAVLGTIYAVADAEENEADLIGRLRTAKHPDGSLVFSLPMVIGLMIFYAFCLQCAATVAVIARETNSWRWPAFAWTYMTGLGYLGAFIAYRLLS